MLMTRQHIVDIVSTLVSIQYNVNIISTTLHHVHGHVLLTLLLASSPVHPVQLAAYYINIMSSYDYGPRSHTFIITAQVHTK